MFGFNKKSGPSESLLINVLIFGTILSGLAKLTFDSYTNKLTIISGKNHGVKIEVNMSSHTSKACGRLGCFNMSNFKFNIDRLETDGALRNQSVQYMDNVQINCEIDPDSDNGMVYWVGSRKEKFFRNASYFYMEGYFYENYTSVNEGNHLNLQNVSGYEDRYFACILYQKNIATIKYSYLTVIGDPVRSHYTDERFDEKAGSPSAVASQNSLLGGIIVTAVVLLLSIIIIISITVYRRRNKVIVKYWLKKVTVETPVSETGELVMPIVRIEKQKLTQVGIRGNDTTLMSEYQMPVDARWEIPRSKISLTGQVLGEGEFGKVVKAESHGVVSDDAKTIVAVKMLKDSCTDEDMKSLVKEMEIMKIIGKHENVINLLGCCTQDGPLYVVVEFARYGCLRNYLKQHKTYKNGSMDNLLYKPLSQRELMVFVWQVAKGMEYLASRGCVHRDLAARNVLVSEDLILKIADFGLARDVSNSHYYRKRTAGKLPMKWMAPESIAQNYYNKRSDVWSFGVITWEIMTFGETPYSKISVYKLFYYLETDNRLEQPVDCSDEMYDLMRHCWAFKPEDRPMFHDIVGTMKTMLNLPENGTPPENQNEYVTMIG